MTPIDWVPFVLVFLLALGISLATIPILDKLGRRWKIVAVAGGRRQSEGDLRGLSKLGGVSLYVSFTITVLLAQLLPVPRFDPYEIIRLAGLLIGGTVIFIFGLLDDIFHFSAFPQFVGQFLAAAIAIVFQIFIQTLNNPLSGQQTDPWPHIVTVTLSFFWLVAMMNTVNWLDGVDGLAGGVAFIAGATLFINSAFRIDPPQTSVSLLPLTLMGCSLGFVLYNFYPARIFMGGGAVYLGYLLGTLSIIGGAKMATILLVMGLPLIDVAWQVINRLRQGRSPFEGDRGHVHFRLVDLGVGQRQIALVYYLFCAFFGALTLIIESRFYKFVAMGVMFLLVIIGFLVLERTRQASSSSSPSSS
jgi:UDP-GlcNAc:undecaprenyl-phosphate GlcNAc-1-phosphate transferase